MAKKVFGSFILVMLTVLIFLYFQTGAYKGVVTEKITAPELQMFYMQNIGPYHKIVEKLNAVEDYFNELEQPCPKTFGHFMNDPEIIDHDKLLSHVGCAFTKEESPQVFTLPENMNEKFFGIELKGKTCYKGTFSGSPSLSALKVVPKLKEMAQKDRVKLAPDYLELYTVNGDAVITEVYLCEE